VDDRLSDVAKLRRQAEKIARENAVHSSGGSEDQSTEDTLATLHELQVHQIELEMQNEELRHVQADLNAERTRYFDLYNRAPVGYFTLSERGRILEANLTSATLLGVAGNALVNNLITDFILPEDQDIFYLCRRRLIIGCSPQACELRMIRKGGSSFWVHIDILSKRDSDGVPICLATMSDITKRKKAEEALQESEERYRSYVNKAPYGVFVADENGRYLDVNPMACKITGYDEHELLHMSISDLLPPDVHERGISHFQKAQEDNLSFDEMHFLAKNGERRMWSVTATKLNEKRLIGFVEDITDRKYME